MAVADEDDDDGMTSTPALTIPEIGDARENRLPVEVDRLTGEVTAMSAARGRSSCCVAAVEFLRMAVEVPFLAAVAMMTLRLGRPTLGC